MSKLSIKQLRELYSFYSPLKSKQWDFLIENIDLIEPLDYQWFFHNNLSTKIVYK